MVMLPVLVAQLALSAVPSTAARPPQDIDLGRLLPAATESERSSALAEIARSKDQRYMPPLLDLLAAADTPEEWYAALDALSPLVGEDTREIDSPWRTLSERRYGAELPPLPTGYAGFKAELLAQEVDPAFRRFLGANVPSQIRWDEVQWGGVPVDGIPALTDAPMVEAGQAESLADSAPIFGIEMNGEARAYPTQILDWHEMANDVIGGVPVTLSWCTLCGAPIAYRSELGEPAVRQIFGSSGLLFRSNKLMYDRATDSLWNQLTGRPVVGPLAAAEDTAALKTVFVRTTTWGAWKRDHPETLVLAASTGWERDYTPGAAYGDYFAAPKTMFPVPPGAAKFEPKERIYVVYLNGKTFAAPLEALDPERPLRLGDPKSGVTVISLEPPNADAKPRARLHPFHDAMAFATGSRTFERGTDGALYDQQGLRWQRTERALTSPTGERCSRVQAHPAFGFAWNAMLADSARVPVSAERPRGPHEPDPPRDL